MRIAVCLKAVRLVPGSGSGGGGDAEEGRAINEWDAYALEEAIALSELNSGGVTALSVGAEETHSPLRRALALGASGACRIAADGNDPYRVAEGIAAYLGAFPHDIVLFGAQSSDRGGGQVGGMAAARLGLPFVSLATRFVSQGNHLLVEREIENRRHERYRVSLPCIVSVQTGINAPRYVSVRGIQRAARLPVEIFAPPETETPRVTLVRRIPPEQGAGRILPGDARTIAGELAAAIRARRGL